MNEQTVQTSAPKRDLAKFKKMVDALIATNASKTSRYGYDGTTSWFDWNNASRQQKEYAMDDIRSILGTENSASIVKMSNYFYRTSGVYRSLINYYSTLLLCSTIITPRFGLTPPPKRKVLAKFNAASDFVDSLDLTATFPAIVRRMLLNGTYYGMLRVFPTGVVFQELPPDYCRTNWKDENGIQVLEFDLDYFTQFESDPDLLRRTLEGYPPEFMKAFRQYRQGKDPKSIDKNSRWYEVPHEIGLAFFFFEQRPMFANMIPAALRYDESQDREADRDEEELSKIFINRMPIDAHGELPIDLPEIEEIHRGIAEMLSGNPYIEVVTGLGEMKLEQAQASSSNATSDNTDKFKNAVYDQNGTSSELFNATGNTTLKYSVNRDTSLMMVFANQFSFWLTYQLNYRFGEDTRMTFDVEILPITMHNKEDMMDLYLKGGQYGMPGFYAAVGMGIKQGNLVNMLEFENDFIGLKEKMIPLQSSHIGDGNVGATGSSGDSTSRGPGRPTLPDSQKSEKTIANQNSD